MASLQPSCCKGRENQGWARRFAPSGVPSGRPMFGRRHLLVCCKPSVASFPFVQQCSRSPQTRVSINYLTRTLVMPIIADGLTISATYASVSYSTFRCQNITIATEPSLNHALHTTSCIEQFSTPLTRRAKRDKSLLSGIMRGKDVGLRQPLRRKNGASPPVLAIITNQYASWQYAGT